MDDKFLFSVTLANVDYIGLASAYFIDFEKKEMPEKTVITPFGIGCNMPECVDENISFRHRKMTFNINHRSGEIGIQVNSKSFQGKNLSASITVLKPENHDTLNVVIPWDASHFQFTSKQNCLPATGTVSLDDKVYEFNPEKTFACLDFGRGIWHYFTTWNWASFSTRQNGDVIGVNLGGRWTDGTRMTENGICLNGELFKISDDLIFTYNDKNFMLPWTIRTKNTSLINLNFYPFYERAVRTNLVLLKSEAHQMFGHFYGTLVADKKTIKIDGPIGWAEEHVALW